MGLFSTIFRNKGKSEQSAIGKQIKLRAEEFVITYGEQYKGLDYSPQSINVLDHLLSEFATHWKEISTESKNEVLTNVSSYLLWVAQQQYGGNFYWSEQHLQPVLVIGEPAYRVALMPLNNIRNRVELGDMHSITSHYRKIAEEVQKAVDKTDILIA